MKETYLLEPETEIMTLMFTMFTLNLLCLVIKRDGFINFNHEIHVDLIKIANCFVFTKECMK